MKAFFNFIVELATFIIIVLLVGFALMYCWNQFAPQVFGFKAITFVQALWLEVFMMIISLLTIKR